MSHNDIFYTWRRSLSLATIADLGLDHNVNYLLHFLRLSIVTWLHATSSLIETVCAKWRILAYITIILNTDMGMPKRWVTINWLLLKQFTVATPQLFLTLHGCRLSPQGCVPVKWTAPEILFGDAAALSSKSDVYVLLEIKMQSCLLFFSERMTFPRETTIKSISISREEYSMSHVVIQPHPSSCHLKTLVTTKQIYFFVFLWSLIYFNGKFMIQTFLVEL